MVTRSSSEVSERVARNQEPWWVAKLDMTLAGQKVWAGQLVRPTGARRDDAIFGEHSRWTRRFEGRESDATPCGTDGCPALFITLGQLDRHRQLVHAPEREYRERRRAEEVRYAAEREESGETIGGMPVESVRQGPGGPVPYIKPALG